MWKTNYRLIMNHSSKNGDIDRLNREYSSILFKIR